MKKLFAILLAFVFMFMSACGLLEVPEPTPFENGDDDHRETEPVPQKGGSLKVPVTQIGTWNPLLVDSVDVLNFMSLIYESVAALDENLRPVPALASGWEVSADGRLWTFSMRKDAKWHNGEPVAAEDVIFTFEALQSGLLDSYYQKHLYGNGNILEIGLRNNDLYTFYVRLAEPDSNLASKMTFPVVSKSYYVSVENMMKKKDDLSRLPVGTGPYMIDREHEYDGQSITLVRNEAWWGGETYIDKITGIVYSTNEEARNAFFNSEVDLVDTMAIYVNIHSVPDKVDLYKFMTNNYEFLGLNNSSPVLDDINVRKAIAYAIDRKEIISKVYQNNAETVDVPIPPSHWLYNSTYRVYDYDAEKAVKLLRESGWGDIDGNGVLDKLVNNQKIELNLKIITNSDNDFRRDTLNLIEKHLERVGFNVETQIVDLEVLANEIIPEKAFDAILLGYHLDYALDLRFAFHSGEIGNGMSNFMGYASEELDSLLDAAAWSLDENELKLNYEKLQQHMIKDLPVISLYFRTGSLLVNRRVHRVGRYFQLGIYRNIKDWFISE